MAASKSLLEIISTNRKYWETQSQQDVTANDAHLRYIAQALDQIPVLECGGEANPDLLKTLNHDHDTLPYLFILGARIKIALAQSKAGLPKVLRAGGELWNKAVEALESSNQTEARYAASSWQTLIEGVLESALHGSTAERPPALSLEAATAGILRVNPSEGALSTGHVILVRACLQSGCYAQAKPVLDRKVNILPPSSVAGHDGTFNSRHPSGNFSTSVDNRFSTAISLRDILEYYLGGAMIYIALGDWTHATQFLEHVLSTPCSGQGAAHALMLEAYKKWKLTTLLAIGRSKSLPKTVNSGAMRSVSAMSKEYESVAEAFKLADGKKLHAEVHEAMEEFREAGNEGLVRNVVARHQQLVVGKLADTYSVVPFSMVALHLGTSESEAETYVQGLVEQGLVHATVEQQQSQPVLRFGETRALKSEQELRAELIEQTQRIKALSAHVAEVDRRLGISKEFIEHTIKFRKQKAPPKEIQEQEEAMDMSFGGPVSEEDEESVMADVG